MRTAQTPRQAFVAQSTIRDVAARAGVSVATVSNVFTGNRPVTDAVAKRVHEAADALSYKLNRAASQLRSGKVRVVGILVPNLNDTFFTSLVSKLELRAGEAGFQVLVASSHDDEVHEPA